MRWSIEELFYALSIHKEHRFWRRLTRFPRNTWRRIKVIFFWIFTGYTHETLWSLHDYFTKTIIFRLKKFLKTQKMGYPNSSDSQETWNDEIREMIENFEILEEERYVQEAIDFDKPTLGRLNEEESEKFRIALQKQEKHNKETLQQFINNYFDLWD